MNKCHFHGENKRTNKELVEEKLNLMMIHPFAVPKQYLDYLKNGCDCSKEKK